MAGAGCPVMALIAGLVVFAYDRYSPALYYVTGQKIHYGMYFRGADGRAAVRDGAAEVEVRHQLGGDGGDERSRDHREQQDADGAGEQVDGVGAEQEHRVEAELAALAAPREERQRPGEDEEAVAGPLAIAVDVTEAEPAADNPAP